MIRLTAPSLTVIGALVATSVATSQTPSAGWRGDGTGRFQGATPPLEWSAGEDLVWKTEVGEGYATPVVIAGRVLVSAEEDKLHCLDAETGELLWTRENGFGELPPGERAAAKAYASDCGYATPTPVSDGARIWVSYGTGVVACYDMDGNRQWIRQLQREPTTSHGRSASPVLVGEMLIVSISHLTALDAVTGEVRWVQEGSEERYGTPISAAVGDQDVLVTPAGEVVDPSDGRVLADGMTGAGYTSPVADDDVVYFLDAESSAWTLQRNAAGELRAEERWTAYLDGEFFASPLLDEGILYGVNADGVLHAIAAPTGGTIHEQKLPSGTAPVAGSAGVYPSIAMAGGHLLVANDVGELLAIPVGAGLEPAGRSRLPGDTGAMPVAVGARLYIRSGDALYCISRE